MAVTRLMVMSSPVVLGVGLRRVPLGVVTVWTNAIVVEPLMVLVHVKVREPEDALVLVSMALAAMVAPPTWSTDVIGRVLFVSAVHV